MIDCISRRKLFRITQSISKIVTKNNILYVCRVLHPSLSEITTTHNLMQFSVRDFSISNVKNIPQNKTILAVRCKKNKESQGLSVNINVHKCVHKCVGFRECLGVHKNKLAYLQYTVNTICQALVHK